ncbi:hypothetical protein [Methylobacterium aquaticum]|uniref:hypothetical protein n=1 Tax=Methylobacterium aquaticum TaxID=270351 RepID=UPI0011AE4F70|nr:hypothetical protein [Methylobacterium aquaticum]
MDEGAQPAIAQRIGASFLRTNQIKELAGEKLDSRPVERLVPAKDWNANPFPHKPLKSLGYFRSSDPAGIVSEDSTAREVMS